MAQTRRDFIRFIVAGSMAAGCPVDLALLADPAPAEIDGEHNTVCHAVRDGYRFDRPAVSEHHDVIIVGGGVSGLTAAYLLQQHDFLILEKEPHWGGNAYLEEYGGQAFATGAAFTARDETGVIGLAKQLGLEMLPVSDPDGTIVHGEFVPDTWNTGLDRLPYPASVRESFKKFRREVIEKHVTDRRALDSEPLAKYCEGYAPEVKQWWDGFGPSNWGARTEDTSAMLVVGERSALDLEDNRITWPGGLGAITRALSQKLQATHGDRMRAGATTVAVEQENREVRLTYVHDGRVKAAAAKAVIMATPKFITWRLVAGLPARQVEAMKKVRYAPYPVINLVFDKPVFNRGYDTWCPGNTFTDFIVADWTMQRNKPEYRQKYNILTLYTPLREDQRALLLTEEGCRQIAASVLRDFQRLFPGSNADPAEVHLYRRGHPMYMSTPGLFTQVLPLTRQPVGRIAFANTDSEGPVSTTSEGIRAAHRAVEEIGRVLTGRSATADSDPRRIVALGA